MKVVDIRKNEIKVSRKSFKLIMTLTKSPVETGEKTFLVIDIDLSYNTILYIG